MVIHLLFQTEIHSLPQEGDEESTENSNPHRRGLLEMGREGNLVGDIDNTTVLVSEIFIFERDHWSASGVQVRRVRRGRET